MTKLEQLYEDLDKVNNCRVNNLKELGTAINKRKEIERLILNLKSENDGI